MYIRMTFRAVEVYQLLEPLMNDYRKLRKLSTSESPLLRLLNSKFNPHSFCFFLQMATP